MNPVSADILDAAPFYDATAATYDLMTAFRTRVEREAATLAPLLERFPIARGADMGCGTGAHTLALASLGVDATGYDISDQMLQRARDHAAGRPGASFESGDFLTEDLIVRAPFDAIFCLGNSLPHLDGTDELARVLAHWQRALRPGGRIVVQLLNYSSVLRTRDRIIGVRSEGGTTLVRFYDFTAPRLTFNILTIDARSTPPTHTLRSTLLTPFTADDLRAAAHAAGFSAVDVYGTLSMQPFHDEQRDLVAILTAP